MKMVMQLAGLMVVLALAMPALSLRDMTDTLRPRADAPVEREAPRRVARAERTEPKRRTPPGKATIEADGRGHFVVEARLNRKRVEVLVDTGASSVAINRSLAKRIGYRLKDKDFIHTARTANGETRMAVVTLDRVKIGRVEVRDVEAAVLDDSSLDTVLLGMSFLRRLKSFEVRDGTMRLVR